MKIEKKKVIEILKKHEKEMENGTMPDSDELLRDLYNEKQAIRNN